MALAGAALAQQVITIPLDPPATDTDTETEAREYDPSGTAPDTRQNIAAEEDEQFSDSIDLPPAPSNESLSDEELMERFLQPIEAGPIYNAEVDGPENLPAPIPDEEGISRIAVVRGLDKITAEVRDVEVPVGAPVMYNSFEIVAQTCDRRPPEETPETTAFIQITEHRQDGTLERIFSGWMYASSPSLNPVEHSTYDVWLIDCRTL